MPVVDLRSDTLTVPTEAMRSAMREAEVGDDGRVDAEGRGGDPTVNRLEDHGFGDHANPGLGVGLHEIRHTVASWLVGNCSDMKTPPSMNWRRC